MASRTFDSEAVAFSHPRVQQLDPLTSLRFFAALYVVVFHYGDSFFDKPLLCVFLPLGYSGVTFFFMLSGFILSYNYRNVKFDACQEIMDYLIARLARIYPIFGLSILLSLPFFVGSLMHISSPYTHLLAASAILFAPLGLHAWVPGAACALNCPSWSISTEFFFYLLFPFILWRILRRPVAWSVATAIYLLLTWILLERLWSLYGQGFSLTGHSAHDHASTNLVSQFIMYFPPNRLPEFMSGVLLFVLWSMGGRYCKNVPLLVSAFLLASFVVFAFRDVIPDVALSNGFTAIAWAPLILAGASMRSGLLSWPPLIFLGRISFSLYMLHIPAAQIVVSVDKYLLGGVVSSFPLLMLLCKLFLAGLMSTAAYCLVEEPGRHYIRRLWRVYQNVPVVVRL